ncbi:hypothetical protein [Oceaniglobus trochenteri]|uniref:hypothetical protein n=1 Tax=Oceaniglobus trochenteri TaxID=2763260 RepID=UPI001CFF7BF5|nr:hypothetical protein [Oceaniglobus trochenteri]
MQLTNTTKSDLGLDPETIVPAMGTLEISNDALTRHKANPIIKHWLVSGDLVEDGAVEDDTDRNAAIRAAVAGLSSDDFTKAGKPKVEAVNLLMPEGMEKVTADEIDAATAG